MSVAVENIRKPSNRMRGNSGEDKYWSPNLAEQIQFPMALSSINNYIESQFNFAFIFIFTKRTGYNHPNPMALSINHHAHVRSIINNYYLQKLKTKCKCSSPLQLMFIWVATPETYALSVGRHPSHHIASPHS